MASLVGKKVVFIGSGHMAEAMIGALGALAIPGGGQDSPARLAAIESLGGRSISNGLNSK